MKLFWQPFDPGAGLAEEAAVVGVTSSNHHNPERISALGIDSGRITGKPEVTIDNRRYHSRSGQ
jgi:hypothetical protein